MGPGFCAEEYPLPGNSWQNSTNRNMAGLRIIADCKANAVFKLVTRMGTFEFPASAVIQDGYLVIPAGTSYSYCNIVITRCNFYWFQPPPRLGQQVFNAAELGLKYREWNRTQTAWLSPGAMVEAEIHVEQESTSEKLIQGLLHIVAMAAQHETAGRENSVHDYFPMSLYLDGEKILDFTQYFRNHDYVMQLLQDIWLRFPISKGIHRLGLRNNHRQYFILINRLIFEEKEYRHLQLLLPQWGLVNELLTGRIFSTKNIETTLTWPGETRHLTLNPGWNEFDFVIQTPGQNILLQAQDTVVTSHGILGPIYNLKNESTEVLVGYDMTVVPHDDNGFMDYLLDYTARTQLGNMVVFRSFTYQSPDSWDWAEVNASSLARWGEFCRKHRIYVEGCTSYEDGALVKSAGNYSHGIGGHEYSGVLYGALPEPPDQSKDMKIAATKYIDYLKFRIAKTREISSPVAFGDASGGQRYAYLAGIDYLRSETMVGHTMHLCSQARPCAEALGKGEWGVHIAIQHGIQPHFENHLGLYFLSLMQPWMMGASMFYEEDSLFCLFKEERQSWDDALTKGKRDMTRDFYRWVKTHPRTGRNLRNIAFVEGRYAAPFQSFNGYTDRDYPVWGRFGSNDTTWIHRQPEKCRHLLDVLMPGAFADPFKQRFDRLHFFFSGTPHGDFDQIPTEASADYFSNYRLLLHLGWNTMIQEDYDKILHFVKQGGTIFIGIPQFSTHTTRDFLDDLKNLALWHDGDLRELCGVKIIAPDVEYSGQWNTAHREEYLDLPLSAMPSHNFPVDQTCYLAKIVMAGAQVSVWDAENGQPLVVEHKVGKGRVYLLTAWAYPGHDRLQPLCASFIDHLAQQAKGDCYIDDPSREVFWTVWQENSTVIKMMLLNTDWLHRSNVKVVNVIAPGLSLRLELVERTPYILIILPFVIIRAEKKFTDRSS